MNVLFYYYYYYLVQCVTSGDAQLLSGLNAGAGSELSR